MFSGTVKSARFPSAPSGNAQKPFETNTFCVLMIWVGNLTVAKRFWGLKVVVCSKVVQKPFEFIVFLIGFPPLRKRFKTQCLFSKNNPQKSINGSKSNPNVKMFYKQFYKKIEAGGREKLFPGS